MYKLTKAKSKEKNYNKLPMNISLRYAFVCIYWPQNVFEVEQLSLKRAFVNLEQKVILDPFI